MIYLKLFDTESDYLAYRDGANYLKPNVSLCDDNGDVYYNYPPPIIYDYVDLDLPSGTKWATQNVGARKPSDAGLYFQWGDTSGYTADQVGMDDEQKRFSQDNSDYKWYDTDKKTFTKYTTFGATLEIEDDAAHVNMGGDWHMPTPNQFQELLNTAYTTNEWTTLDGVNGRLFTSKKDSSKSIFIPAAGYAMNGLVNSSGDVGRVWSSTLSSGYVGGGLNLYFDSGSANIGYGGLNRYNGLHVRGVIG